MKPQRLSSTSTHTPHLISKTFRFLTKVGAIGMVGSVNICSMNAAESSQSPTSGIAGIPVAYTDHLKSAAEIRDRKLDPLNPRVDRFHKGGFPVGFYVYGQADIEEHIERMAQLGFTSVHVTATSDREKWASLLQLCRERGMSVLAQLDTVYLTPDSKVEDLVPRAVSIIQRSKDDPAVLAFSIREEPPASLMPALSQYYRGIYRSLPDAPLYLLHNYLKVMHEGEPPFPAMIGTDRYAYWWEFNTAGNRATPASALRWYHTQLNAYYQDSLRQNGEFFAVFSALASSIGITKEKVKEHFYPNTIPESQREKLAGMVDRFAQEKNQGWWETEPGVYRHWKYYAPPGNNVRAMCWLSVMEGAKSVYCYHWLRTEKVVYRDGGAEYQMNAAQLAEYSEFAREIQRYGTLIRAMTKEFTPYIGSPLGHEVVETQPVAAPLVESRQKHTAWRAFRVNGYEGRVVATVNTDVGEWCEGTSPATLTAEHQFRIGDNGELLDYKAHTEPRELELSILKNEMACLDLETGKPVSISATGRITVSVKPGGGRFLFIYPAASREGEAFRKEFKL